MNDLIAILGLNAWKPILAALLLPPLPFLLLALIGARLMYWRRGVAWLILLLSAALVWLSCSSALGELLEQTLLSRYHQPLSSQQVGQLRVAKPGTRQIAIVVLGAGREQSAPEYGVANLKPLALARLHYGLWLSRQTGAPVMFSGGISHGEPVGTPEADAAARIAEADYGRPLKWVDNQSRDTRENAANAVSMLQAAGINELVLVTHGWHMPRAMRAFQTEVRRLSTPIQLIPAPMGLARDSGSSVRWLPTADGFSRVRFVLREWFAMLAGT